MKRQPHPRGEHHGTGSGRELDIRELRKSGVTFNLAELLECVSKAIDDKEFPEDEFMSAVKDEIVIGALQELIKPNPTNRYGLYRFDPQHPSHVEGSPEWKIMMDRGPGFIDKVLALHGDKPRNKGRREFDAKVEDKGSPGGEQKSGGEKESGGEDGKPNQAELWWEEREKEWREKEKSRPSLKELRRTGQIFSLKELHEYTRADAGGAEFSYQLFLEIVRFELRLGTLQCLEYPDPRCEHGLYRFDCFHPANIPGTAENHFLRNLGSLTGS